MKLHVERREKDGGKDHCPSQIHSILLCTCLATFLIVNIGMGGGNERQVQTGEHVRRAGGVSATQLPNAVTSLCDAINVTKKRQMVLSCTTAHVRSRTV